MLARNISTLSNASTRNFCTSQRFASNKMQTFSTTQSPLSLTSRKMHHQVIENQNFASCKIQREIKLRQSLKWNRRMMSSSGEDSVKGRGPVSWTMLGVVGVAAAAAVAYYRVERERRLEKALGTIVSTGKPAIGGPWSLIDLEGHLVTEKSFAGKWTLLYFGFARCPDICPSEMVKVAKVMDMLKKQNPDLAKDVVPVFVSVDPARDSLKALKEYAKDFHPDYIFLTGAPEQVQQMAKKYRVYVSKADETEDGDYLVDHSIVIYFHDDKGELADVFTQSMKPTDVMEKVVRAMTFVPSF